MKYYLSLMRVQLKEIFDFRRLFGSERNKTFSFLSVFAIAVLVIVIVSFFYAYFILVFFKEIHIGEYFPAFTFSVTSIMILYSTILRANGTIFGSKDYEFLQSIPVPLGVVVAVKITILYIYELAFSLILMIPSIIMYGIMGNPEALSMFYIILMVPLLPIIPIAVSSIIGFVVSLLFERFRFKKIISSIVYAIIFGTLVYFSFIHHYPNMGDLWSERIVFGLKQIYPPTCFFLSATIDYNFGSFVLFLLISLGMTIIFSFIIGLGYTYINSMIFNNSQHHKYKSIHLKSHSFFVSIMKKDFKKLMKTPLYLFNTAFGGIFIICFALILLLFSDYLVNFNDLGITPEIVSLLALFVTGTMLMVAPITAPAISIEGHNLWVIKSAPISAKPYFFSKICLHTFIMTIMSLITSVIFIIHFNPNPWMLILFIIVPIYYNIISGYIGIFCGIYYAKLEWSNEMDAVKNTSSVILAMIYGIGYLGIYSLIAALCYIFLGIIGLFIIINIFSIITIIVMHLILMKKSDNLLLNL